jgi:ATP-dependent helicase/DNAse subunit B
VAIGDSKILSREAFHPSASSPTRLEAYAKCSYLYFAERVLKLQETEADTRARVQGTIMHGVLEDFFKAAWRGLSQEETLSQIDALLEKYAAQEPLDLGPHQTALATLEMKNMLTRFIAFERERLEESAFQPRYFEYEIPKDNPVTLRRDDAEVVLQGKIDRVDVDAQNQFFVISDYKRSRNFDKNSVEDGTSLQLPLYLLAVEKVLGLKPAGGQLLNLKDLKVTGFYSEAVAEAKTKMGAEAFDAVLRRALKYSARYLKELAQGRIEVMPRDCVDKCSFSPLCRIEKWKLPEIAEKIRAEDKKLGF